jgi:hypothetical protein
MRTTAPAAAVAAATALHAPAERLSDRFVPPGWHLITAAAPSTRSRAMIRTTPS